MTPKATAAGITDVPVDWASLSPEQLEDRVDRIDQIVKLLTMRKMVLLPDDQREVLVLLIAGKTYSIAQIERAAEIVATMDTYTRPLAYEYWHKAFSEPTYTHQDVSRLLVSARRDERDRVYRAANDEIHREVAAQRERIDQAGYDRGFAEGMNAGIPAGELEMRDEIQALKSERHYLQGKVEELDRARQAFTIKLLDVEADHEQAMLRAAEVVAPSLKPTPVECPYCRKEFAVAFRSDERRNVRKFR